MKVALCCIGRLENQYAKEFVEHYKSLGFDKIFIYDNNYDGEEHFEDVIKEYISSGLVDVINFRNKEICQLEAYNDCYKKNGSEYDWILFCDFDEFLVIESGGDVHTFMERYEKYECLLINWMIMDDNGQIYNTHRPLMERFTHPMDFDKCCGYNFPENNHIKSFVRGGLENLEFGTNPHVPSSPLKCCNTKKRKVKQAPFVKYDFSVVYLKHFQYKTAEEWIENKRRRGMADQTYETFLKNTPIENFFRVNEMSWDKLEYLNKHRKQLVIVSMTTIPKRMKRLIDNLPYLLRQSYRYDKLIINIDDNLSDEEYKWYEELKKIDDRIEINKSEAKWRSCNKLLPTLKKYPHDVIITLDDDVAYPIDTIKCLVEEHAKHPECIIAHEVNPLDIRGNFVSYVNGYDVKLMQVELGKYLSNCALFPPYSFDDDLYDYDKMMECTNGTHDELWFWVQSTIHKVQCIGLNYVRSFAPEMLEEYKEGEYCLSSFNNNDEKINDYMQKINNMYGERLLASINSKPCVFTLNKDNIYAYLFLLPYIKNIYKAYLLNVSSLTKDWKNKIINILKDKETPRI